MATVRYTLDPNNLKGLSPETLARIDALTPEQIEENAAHGPPTTRQ